MNITGLNALDPRVAATEKYVQKLMSEKKLAPDQVPQFLLSMGADPRLVGLVSKFQRLQTASAQGQPAQAPQTTVAQDVEAQQRGIAAPMAPVQGRDQGIAALPAPAMARAKFADGGIIAFQEGGDTDLTQLSAEDLEEIAGGGDREKAKAAYRERLRRSGYVPPQEYFQRYVELVKEGIPKGGAFKFDSRPFPSYMYDEQGNVRRDDRALAGISGTKEVPSSGAMVRNLSPDTPAKFAQTQAKFEERLDSGVPSDVARTSGTGRRNWAGAKQQNRKTKESTRPIPDLFVLGDTDKPRAGTSIGAGIGTGAGQINEGIKILRDQVKELKNLKPEDREARYRAAGIEDMTPKQLAKIEDRISKLSGDKKRDAYMALAQAGFKMAAAASKPGATVLGAFGEGASEGAKMMADINKEYRALQSDLEDKVMSLQRYQQERKEGRIDRDIDYERDLAREIRGTEAKIGELTEDARRFGITTRLQERQLAQQAEASRRSEDPIRELKRAYLSTRDPRQREQILESMVKLNEADTRAYLKQLEIAGMIRRDEAKNSLENLGLGGAFGGNEGWGDVRVK